MKKMYDNLWLKYCSVSVLSLTILFMVACDISGHSGKEQKIVTVSLGMERGVVKEKLQKENYKTVVRKTSEINEENNKLFYQYKPISPYYSVHKKWVGSYFELVFQEDVLLEINWKNMDGCVIEKWLQKINLGKSKENKYITE